MYENSGREAIKRRLVLKQDEFLEDKRSDSMFGGQQDNWPFYDEVPAFMREEPEETPSHGVRESIVGYGPDMRIIDGEREIVLSGRVARIIGWIIQRREQLNSLPEGEIRVSFRTSELWAWFTDLLEDIK